MLKCLCWAWRGRREDAARGGDGQCYVEVDEKRGETDTDETHVAVEVVAETVRVRSSVDRGSEDCSKTRIEKAVSSRLDAKKLYQQSGLGLTALGENWKLYALFSVVVPQCPDLGLDLRKGRDGEQGGES